MPNDTQQAGFRLGDALFGGPQRRAEANYPAYLKQAADGASALDRAAIVRAQRIARDNLPAAIAADPSMAAHGGLAAAILGMATGQPNLGTYTEGLGDLADQAIDQQRQDALTAGDVPQYNRLTALRKDKDYQPVRVVAGNAMEDGVSLGDLAMVPLPQTLAGIEQKQALGDAAMVRANATAGREAAHAGVYDAQAAAGGFNPNTGRKPKASDGEPTLGGYVVPAEGRPAEGDVLQAMQDARRAIATGRITKEAARQRLIDAGMPNAAGRL